MKKPKGSETHLRRDYCLFMDGRKYNRNAGCKAHDNAYGRFGGGSEADRKEADRALFSHMRAEHDPMAWIAYLFVRFYGWMYFNYHGCPWRGQLLRLRMPQYLRDMPRLVIPSCGIRRIRHLAAFLPEYRITCGRADMYAGWGHKPTADKVRKRAAHERKPYIALEDGFLRSFGLGDAPPLSLVLDRSGIYYDATAPSDLESMLEAGSFSPEELSRAAGCRTWMLEEGLTKYNGFMEEYEGEPIHLLLVDQTEGDAAITLGLADASSFERMMDEALSHYPPEAIAVKLHPDTVTGKKRGYLKEMAEARGIRVIAGRVNPVSLLRKVEKVATVSSQLGFEAVMLGKQVYTYGMPFYAGWRLTEDRISCPRRTRPVTRDELFAAVYLRYARYIDPFTGEASTLERTIALLAALSYRERLTRRHFIAYGFSPWKRRFLARFLGRNIVFRRRYRGEEGTHLVWSSRYDSLVARGRISKELPVWRMEDGFLRSRGLGAKLVRPWSLVLDPEGIYYDPAHPSALEDILERHECSDALLRYVASLRKRIVSLSLSKYNLSGDADIPEIPTGRTVILVPGQVENDASVLRGGGRIQGNLALLAAVREANPHAFILYKPHPDVLHAGRKGQVGLADARRYADEVLGDIAIPRLWPVVDEVHTLTSLAGFEALLYGKRVHCYGLPFYAGWGVTFDHLSCTRRTRVLSLDALIAGVLVHYPLYHDWRSGMPCDVEAVIMRLSAAPNGGYGRGSTPRSAAPCHTQQGSGKRPK